jgi:hypothetical protein
LHGFKKKNSIFRQFFEALRRLEIGIFRVYMAEWMVEIFDAYCRTVILALQLGKPLVPIPADKFDDLRQIRQTIGC